MGWNRILDEKGFELALSFFDWFGKAEQNWELKKCEK